MEELHAGLKTHKELVAKWFPDYQQSKGVGRDAFVSQEDLVCVISKELPSGLSSNLLSSLRVLTPRLSRKTLRRI